MADSDRRDNFIEEDGYKIKFRQKQNAEPEERPPSNADWNKRRNRKKKPNRGNKREL